MKPHLVAAHTYNHGTRTLSKPEPHLDSLRFQVFSCSHRSRPETEHRVIIPAFSEFGCEVVGSLYCLPRLVRLFPGYHRTVVGWLGREYLYRHQVDEFWELSQEQQWLREYCRAFHHTSVNLGRFEKRLHGLVIKPSYMARLALVSQCPDCDGYFKEPGDYSVCPRCESDRIRRAFFHDMPRCWSEVVLPPDPGEDKIAWAKERLPDNPVGVFARARKCYGRNLPPEFYLALIKRLRKLGYNPVWLGEPATNLPCPSRTVTDFTVMPEQRDLETTLAILKCLRFTVQFWTASTRLAAIAGTPYLLFESPDQLWGNGQEGYRLELITRDGPRKVIANHYHSVLNDHEGGLDVLEAGVMDIEAGDFSDRIGLVGEVGLVTQQMNSFHKLVRR